MVSDRETAAAALPVAEWVFPASAALGSSVRAQGIEREMKARLAFPDRKHLTVEDGRIRLRFAVGQEGRLAAAARLVDEVLARIDTLPVLPSEVEDILTISSRERQKWLKDGRLQSAGTRTVKLRGRAKTVTFHVLDPRHVEDVLDRDLPAIWREEDAAAKAEARRRAAGKAALTRAEQGATKPKLARSKPADGGEAASRLKAWKAFAEEGLLR